jgi:hypothetical protein
VSADFNGDGIPDLAILVTDGLSIMLGTGKALAPYTQGQVLSIASAGCPVEGDLNGDGIPDLLAPSGSPSGSAVAFLGNGDGTFTQVAQTTPMSATGFLAVGDFNGDGILDWASSSNLLALGNGDGTFQTPAAYIPHVYPGSVFGIAAARLTGNKESDIVLTNPDAQLVYVLLSNGAAFKQTTFSVFDVPVNCDAPAWVVLADVNGDGSPDLLMECGGDGTTPIFLNNGEGQFTYSTSLADFSPEGGAIPAVADVNGDGIADVVILSGDINVYLGEGSMMFEGARDPGIGAGHLRARCTRAKAEIGSSRYRRTGLERGFGRNLQYDC